ncbi:hypothetical protein RU85_GL001130 [Lactococcus garvieae]|nr:hypothetical protein RU85_GL001130 [Lactococcus garvieae]
MPASLDTLKGYSDYSKSLIFLQEFTTDPPFKIKIIINIQNISIL